MKRNNSAMTFGGIVCVVACLMLISRLAADAHPNYKPQKVTGVPTYKNTSEIGNAIFTLQLTRHDQKEYPASLETLEATANNIPEVYCRRFFPCTLKEAMDYIKSREPTASDFRLQGNIKLYKGTSDMIAIAVTKPEIKGDLLTWNTARVDLKESLGDKFTGLTPGEYLVRVDTYVTYEYLEDKITGKKAPSNILLAAGKLKIVVK